jgi:hypothetical protein
MALKKELREAYEEAGVTADQIVKLEEVFTDEEILSKLTAQHMKAADYTTKTQALAEAKRKFEQEQQQFTEGRDYLDGQMNQYKLDMEKRLNDALAQVTQSSLRGAALETKLRTLAAQYGEDPAELLSDVKEAREEKKKDAAPIFDDEEFKKRYVPRDEFTNAANQIYAYPTMIRDFERDYQKTFGKEYDGSLTDLINEASREVQQLHQRGQKNVDLFGHIRSKLDFAGQQTRNQEAAKATSAKEREDWEKNKTEEIERNLRTKLAAENPGAYRGTWDNKPEAWRSNLNAQARQNKLPDQSAVAQHQRQAGLHAKFEELAAKVEAGGAV